MPKTAKEELDVFRVELAYKIRSIREAREWTLGELAQRLDVSQATVQKYESGRETPSLLYCSRIAKLGGVTLDDLANLSKKDFLVKVYSMFD